MSQKTISEQSAKTYDNIPWAVFCIEKMRDAPNGECAEDKSEPKFHQVFFC